jgi:hypothetical protein
VIVFPGRKLEYEIKCEKHKSEQNFMTAVKFSAEYPHGKAVALFDLKSASLKVQKVSNHRASFVTRIVLFLIVL